MQTLQPLRTLLAFAALSTSAIAANTVTVHVVNFDFTATGPGGVHFDPTISVGDTVHWVWDQTHHSSQSVAGSIETWASGIQSAGFTFDHTFTNAGDFSYYCEVHGSDNGNGTAAGMSGIVHVMAAPKNSYAETDLVSDVSGRASHLDPNLVNAWGLDKSPTGPWWVNSNGKGLSVVDDGSGNPQSLVVTVPSASGSPTGTPTGIVFNSTSGFNLAPSEPATFLFATEDGTISGWNGAVSATAAIIKVNRSGSAVYKGLAMGQLNGHNVLYAANFLAGTIDVFDAAFGPVTLGQNAFKDASVPAGYAPFNVSNVGGALYVTWAKQDAAKMDDVPGAGFGYVSVFSPAGALTNRLQHGSWMNAPWGIALAPASFGSLSGLILVGQFGNGTIAAFDPSTGQVRGLMKTPTGQTLVISGLWGLSFGNGGSAGPTNSLFFAAGIAKEQHGLFGSIVAQ